MTAPAMFGISEYVRYTGSGTSTSSPGLSVLRSATNIPCATPVVTEISAGV